MDFPQIRIESQFGKIGITSNRPIQKIEQPQAELTIEQPSAELFIDRRPSKLTIDQTMARENLDLKSVFKRSEENANLGFQTLMEYIAKESQDGDEIMNIAKVKGNPIINQSISALTHISNYNTGNIPPNESVKIEYIPSSLEINWKQNKPIIEVQLNKPIHSYTPGNSVVFMEQYPALKIDFTG
ncbi:DUF6470 family protein [Robertmurraya sp. Marseille-Q9965]